MAGLKELDDPGEACRDVLARDAAGVEGAHRELGARLADRLGRDDADGLTNIDGPVSRERPAVTGLAYAVRTLALGGRPHGNERLARQLLAPGGKEARCDVLACGGDDLSRLGVQHILGDVDEGAGQVAGVGGTQGSVGLALPRAVCRY